MADNEDLGDDVATAVEDGVEETTEDAQKLDLKVNIDKTGACQRHVTVTVSRPDIDADEASRNAHRRPAR